MAKDAFKRLSETGQLFADVSAYGVIFGLFALALCIAEGLDLAFGPLGHSTYATLYLVLAVALVCTALFKAPGAVVWLMNAVERLIPTPRWLQSGYRRLADGLEASGWENLLRALVVGVMAGGLWRIGKGLLADFPDDRFFVVLLTFAAIFGGLIAILLLASVLAGILPGKPKPTSGGT